VTASCRLRHNWAARFAPQAQTQLVLTQPEQIRTHARDLVLRHPGLAGGLLDKGPLLGQQSVRPVAGSEALATDTTSRPTGATDDDDPSDSDEDGHEN
jgi:hypothetical protein